MSPASVWSPPPPCWLRSATPPGSATRVHSTDGGAAPQSRSPPQRATLSPPDTASTCSATAPSTACYMSCRSPKAAITSPPATTWNINGLKATAQKKPAVPTRLCWADAASDACGPTDADNLIIQHPKLPNRIPLDKGASGTCVLPGTCTAPKIRWLQLDDRPESHWPGFDFEL